MGHLGAARRHSQRETQEDCTHHGEGNKEEAHDEGRCAWPPPSDAWRYAPTPAMATTIPAGTPTFNLGDTVFGMATLPATEH